MPKLPLAEAAKRCGLSVNGMRSRAKADPGRYGLTRDNAGRIWLEFDPGEVPAAKVSAEPGAASSRASAEAVAEVLRAQLADVIRDRDHWRTMAETLAARRRWWPW